MSISSISSSEVSFGPEIDSDDLLQEQVEKVHSIWSRAYHTVVDSIHYVIDVSRTAIGAVVCDLFFFPLKCSLITNLQRVKDLLKIEEDYFLDFWDPSKPLDPNLNAQEKIREKFATPHDLTFSISLQNKEKVGITLKVIQTKEEGEEFYNFVHVPGIYSTIDNNIASIYPYMESYLNSDESLPPARFIILSENNVSHKPKSIDEAGFILLKTLEALKGKYGEIDQLVAHSLGNVFFANALKHVEDVELLPKHICFDRAPSSIWEVSKKLYFGLGRLIYCIAKVGRWASDSEQEIVDFCKKWEERPSILITGVKQDHYFSEKANLCLGEKLQKIDGVPTLLFDPPRQIVHETAHHNWHSGLLNKKYLNGSSDFIESSESLSDAIIRHSLPEVLNLESIGSIADNNPTIP